jgi:3-isopropylmalate dehydratase small subunit
MSGRVFLFGDNVDTDQLAPGQYMSGGIAECWPPIAWRVRPDFAGSVRRATLSWPVAISASARRANRPPKP